MKLFRLAAWTIWFMLSWIALAHAGPVAAAVGAIAGILAKGGIAAALIKWAFGLALQVGVSLLKRAMAKKQAQPGITGQVQLGGDKSLSFIVGSYATAGHLEYINTWKSIGKTPNAVLTQVITVSDLPVHEISNRVWVNGKLCTRDPSTAGTGSGAKFGTNSFPLTEYFYKKWHFLFLTYYTGDQTSADSDMVSAYGSDEERPWLSDMIGRGVSYVIASAEIERNLMTAVPAFRFEVKGIKLYDPRKDSTVGGSGSHEWGDESTYEWTDNPAVIIYNILRGIYYGGEWIYGPEVPSAALPLTNWIAAMNECDVLVSLEGGGTEKQYRCGYEIKVNDQEPADVIEELLKACNGRLVENGGTYKIHVGAPALPVAFITDGDFVVTREQSYDPFPGLESTFNGVTATYPEPEAAWEMKDAPQRRFPDYEAEDEGRILLADVQFNAVPFPVQVQRLMTSLAHENRRFRKIVGTLPPWAYVLEPLDVVSYTSARNGFIDKHFLITSMDDQPNANQIVAMTEVDPSDYDWSPSDTLPWTVGALVPSWPMPQVMSGWFVQAVTLQQGGKTLPGVEVFFDGHLTDIRAVEVQVRFYEESGILFHGEIPYGERLEDAGLKSVYIGYPFLPDSEYEVRGRFAPFSARDTEWSEWLYIKTPNVWIFDVYDVDLDRLADDVREWQEWAGGGLREVEQRLEELDQRIADQDLGNSFERHQMRSEISATFGNVAAKWSQEITLLATESEATARRIEEVRAEVYDPVTGIPSLASGLSSLTAYAGPGGTLAQSIVDLESEVFDPLSGLPAVASAVDILETEVSNQGGQLTSMAQAITQLSASTDPNNVAEANYRAQVVAGPSGYSRIVFQTRYGGTGAWRGAAFGLDTPANAANPTIFWADAQRFAFMDTSSGSTVNPLVYESGVWRMNVANIGTVNAGMLQHTSGSGSVTFNLSIGRLLIADNS